MAMFELMTVTVLRLQLHLAMSIKRSAGERQDTDETTVNLLAFRRGGTRVRLDDREAKGFPEGIGERNRFRTNGTTTEMVRAVRFPGTAGVFNLGDSGSDMGNMGVVVLGIGHSVSQTHVGGHFRDYDTDRTGTNMLSCCINQD